MNIPYKSAAILALTSQAQADKSAAIASLSILLNHPAGIGDHSTEDLHKNLNEALSKLVDADDRLDTIIKYFPEITDVLQQK